MKHWGRSSYQHSSLEVRNEGCPLIILKAATRETSKHSKDFLQDIEPRKHIQDQQRTEDGNMPVGNDGRVEGLVMNR